MCKLGRGAHIAGIVAGHYSELSFARKRRMPCELGIDGVPPWFYGNKCIDLAGDVGRKETSWGRPFLPQVLY